ncbi:hypothetical protein [Treponema sp. R80B11-R83G3]
MTGYENTVLKSCTKSNFIYETAAGIFYVWGVNMNNGEKTAVNLFFTENCTKQQYRFETAGLIFNVYGRRNFLIVFIKPTRMGNAVCGNEQIFFTHGVKYE